LTTVDGLFDTDGYRGHSSDIASHLVLTHQAGMTNLLTRAAFEARAAEASLRVDSTAEHTSAIDALMNGIAREVVDHLLFVDEARLPAPIRGTSGFAERFSARGPHDRKGRSLYELDLTRRLMKYPCSYLIYSPSFDGLPAVIKQPIYKRLRDVLTGAEKTEPYRTALSRADRQSIVEILRETKKDLPSTFFSP